MSHTHALAQTTQINTIRRVRAASIGPIPISLPLSSQCSLPRIGLGIHSLHQGKEHCLFVSLIHLIYPVAVIIFFCIALQGLRAGPGGAYLGSECWWAGIIDGNETAGGSRCTCMYYYCYCYCTDTGIFFFFFNGYDLHT